MQQVTLPLLEKRQSQVTSVQTSAFCLEDRQEPGPCSGQKATHVLDCSGCSHGMLREPAVLLRSGPCEPSESFNFLSGQQVRTRCDACPSSTQVERLSPSKTTFAASTSLHPTAAGRSVEADQCPGQHVLTETKASSFTQHQANFWVDQEWCVAPTQLSTALHPHPQ